MVGNHRLIVALSPPSQYQWTEKLSLDLARSELFCLLSVVGEQAGNIGKELLELWQNQSVLSTEAVYDVLSEYARVASETSARISCMVIVFRGTRTTVAALRAGVSLRRGETAKVVIGASDEVEIREGTTQNQDLYFLYTELASRQAEKLLSQSKYPEQLLKQWQETKTEILESTVGAEGLIVGLVLPRQLLDSKVGQGFLEVDQECDINIHRRIGFRLPEGSRVGEKNPLQQRRAHRKAGSGVKQKLGALAGLISERIFRKSEKNVINDPDKAKDEESPDLLINELTSNKSTASADDEKITSLSTLTNTKVLNKETSITLKTFKSIDQSSVKGYSVLNKKIYFVGENDTQVLSEGVNSSKRRAVGEAEEDQNQSESESSELTPTASLTIREDLFNSPKSPEFNEKVEEKQSKAANLANFVKNIGTRLKSRKTVYVGHHLGRKRVLIAIGGILLITVLLIGLGYLRYTQQIAEQAALEKLLPFQEAIASIKALGETDPVSARTQAQSQLAELGRMQAEDNLPSAANTELEKLLNETKALYESLDVVSDLTDLPLFDDLRRLSPSFLASTAAGEGSQGILVDRDQQLLIAYTTGNKNGQVIDVANLEKVIAVAQIGERSYVLGDGVWLLSSPTTTQLAQVIQPATQTEGATLIASFGNNVYVFNPTQRALYRYVASGTRFGTPTNWLTGAAPFTFSEVSSLVVDGGVWIGTNQGQIYHFVGGRQVEFAVAGLDQPLSSTVYLAANPDSELMAVLEPARRRLLVLNKDTGLVKREFINSNLGAATGLWLDEANNQVLVSSGAAIFNILIEDSVFDE